MDEPVSRETPPAPPEARGVFSTALPQAEQYAHLLATEGTLRGLIGPRESERLWERHLLNCAALAEVVPEDALVGDVGSGAGLPGLVLAIARPDVQVTLVEPLLRRTSFLEEVVTTLGLDNVEVLRARAEAVHGSRSFDLVTSRAVAPLPRLLGWCMPLVRPWGAMVAMKGSSAEREIAEAAPELARWGCSAPEVLTVGTVSPATLVRVSWADPARVGSSPGARRPARGSGGQRRRRRGSR